MLFFEIFTLTLTIGWTTGNLNSQECGVPIGSGKIVGGVDTGGYQYPWFAVLLLKTRANQPVPVCGGSLITSNVVLTAAHCFGVNSFLPNIDMFSLALGVYNMCDKEESTREIFNIQDIIIHEKYRKRGKFYDIALIKLEKPANFRVICLPLSGVPDRTEKALLIGFGVTSEGSGLIPCTMLEVNVTKFSRQECLNTELPQEDKNEPSIICAGVMSGNADSCYGDSGGPLQIKNSDGRFVIQGIVSYGYGCGVPKVPGVYTNVGSYITWIKEKISNSVSSSQELTSKNNAKSFSRKRAGVFRRNHKNIMITSTESVKSVEQGFKITSRNVVSKEKVEGNTEKNTKKSKVIFPN